MIHLYLQFQELSYRLQLMLKLINYIVSLQGMQTTSSTDFKIKHLKSSKGPMKKLPDEKSQTTKDDTRRDSISRLKSSEDATKQSVSLLKGTRRPQRPLTGKKKEASIKLIQSQSEPIPQVHVSGKEIVDHLIDHSSKIKDYLVKRNMSEYQAGCRLKDSVFVISLENFIQKNQIILSEAESYKKVERFVTHKLQSEFTYQQQQRTCQNIQQKIQRMIQERLKKLQQL